MSDALNDIVAALLYFTLLYYVLCINVHVTTDTSNPWTFTHHHSIRQHQCPEGLNCWGCRRKVPHKNTKYYKCSIFTDCKGSFQFPLRPFRDSVCSQWYTIALKYKYINIQLIFLCILYEIVLFWQYAVCSIYMLYILYFTWAYFSSWSMSTLSEILYAKTFMTASLQKIEIFPQNPACHILCLWKPQDLHQKINIK